MLFKESLQKLCKRVPWLPMCFGSWVPLRTCTAVQLLAHAEKHWCDLIKKLSQMTRAAFVHMDTFPDHQGGESTLTHGHGASLHCCHEQWSRAQYSNLKALPWSEKPRCFEMSVPGFGYLALAFVALLCVLFMYLFILRRREKILWCSRWAGQSTWGIVSGVLAHWAYRLQKPPIKDITLSCPCDVVLRFN